jgi:hypothetical protein
VSVFTETWAGPLLADATVTAGGTGAIAGPETWTMAGGFAQFGAADPNAIPPALFRVFDRDAPGESILVRQTTGPTWQVTRGDQGTVPVAHAPGFAVHSLISPAGLASLAHGVPSRNGLVLPAAGRLTQPPTWNDPGEHRLAELPVPSGEAITGSVYEALAWGWYHTNNAAGCTMDFGINWAGVGLGGAAFPRPSTAETGTGQGPGRWKMHAVVSVLAGSLATANATVWLAPHNAVDLYDPAFYLERYMISPLDSRAIVTTGPGLVFWIRLIGNNANLSVTLAGSKAWRAA